ncbi:GntR family transcriptional regulator [Ktedonobacteria bacterium brp13]|nr:GntR family transcriptional regulator [Ktedonobacteria bacterium brp13]
MRSKRQAEVDFFPQIERSSHLSLERQIVRAVREAIVCGRLRPGMRLPSSRRLAAQLHVNRNTIVNALAQLIAEEYLTGKPGSGTFVSQQIQISPKPSQHPSLDARWLRPLSPPHVFPPRKDLLEFRVCQPSTNAFPLVQWRKAWHQALQHLPLDDYSPPAGERGLRAAIAEYLARARGLICSPEDVIITNGAIQGIHLVTAATVTPGECVAFEEPGYPLARQVFEYHGAQILPIAVDEDGLRVEALPERQASPLLVYVTPSHQFPLGVRMSATRRLALLDWAVRNDALIIEDDYDSEFRYDAPPLPPLASLDSHDRVVYVGTFSKVLFPGLRIGYVIAAAPLRERLEHLKCLMDYHTNIPTQRSIECFMKEGYFDQHISRMRRLYAEKRSVLEKVLLPLKPVASFRGLEAGLHTFIEFDASVQIDALIQTCLASGILITDVAQYYLADPNRRGLVLGYGGLELPDIEWAGLQLMSSVQLGSHR